MHLTLRVDRLPAYGLGPGEAVVLTDFIHPERGRVRCPAAHLVATDPRLAGRRVRVGRLPPTGDEDSPAVLFAATYLNDDGSATGIGIAVPADDPDDPAALAVADRSVAGWARVMRTRRILLALTGAECCTLTCPAVEEADRAVRRFHERGDTVLVICQGPDSITKTLCRHGATPISSVSDVDRLSAIGGPVSFVPAPGVPAETVAQIAARLRTRFAHVPGQHPDQWCYAASDRMWTIRSVAESCDALLLFHDEERPAETKIPDTHPIHSLAHLAALPLENWATIGILAPTAATPVLREAVTALSGLGPLSVVQRSMTTSIVSPEAITADACEPTAAQPPAPAMPAPTAPSDKAESAHRA